MSPAQAAAGCVVPMSAATTAARPARNRRIPASCPAKAGDAGKTTAALGGSPATGWAISQVKESPQLFHSAEAGGRHRQKDQRAHGELEVTEAPDARAEHAHLRRGPAVA